MDHRVEIDRIMPKNFAYEVERVSPGGNPGHFSFIVRVKCKNEEEAVRWQKDFENNTKSKWIIEKTVASRTKSMNKLEGKTFQYGVNYCCQRSSKNKKHRDGREYCNARMKIRVRYDTARTRRYDRFIRSGFLTVVRITWTHNHPLVEREEIESGKDYEAEDNADLHCDTVAVPSNGVEQGSMTSTCTDLSSFQDNTVTLPSNGVEQESTTICTNAADEQRLLEVNFQAMENWRKIEESLLKENLQLSEDLARIAEERNAAVEKVKEMENLSDSLTKMAEERNAAVEKVKEMGKLCDDLTKMADERDAAVEKVKEMERQLDQAKQHQRQRNPPDLEKCSEQRSLRPRIRRQIQFDTSKKMTVPPMDGGTDVPISSSQVQQRPVAPPPVAVSTPNYPHPTTPPPPDQVLCRTEPLGNYVENWIAQQPSPDKSNNLYLENFAFKIMEGAEEYMYLGSGAGAVFYLNVDKMKREEAKTGRTCWILAKVMMRQRAVTLGRMFGVPVINVEWLKACKRGKAAVSHDKHIIFMP